MINSKFIKLTDRSLKYIIIQVICQWISLLCRIVIVYNIAKTTEDTLAYLLSKDLILKRLGIMIPAVVVTFIVDRIYVKASFSVRSDIKISIREKIYGKLLDLGSAYKDHFSLKDMTRLMTEGTDWIGEYFAKCYSQICYGFLAPITVFIILCFVDLVCAGTLLILVPVLFLAIMISYGTRKKAFEKNYEKYNELSDKFINESNGLEVLKLYGADEDKEQEMKNGSKLFIKKFMKTLTLQLGTGIITDIITYAGMAAGIAIAFSHYETEKIGIAGIMMVIFLAAEFLLPMKKLESLNDVAVKGNISCEKLFGLLDIGVINDSSEYDDDIVEDEETENIDVPEKTQEESIKYRPIDIEFGDMKFKSGSLTAVADISGAEGGCISEVLSYNEEYKELPIVTVSKRSFIFTGTVRENLKIADPGAEDEKLQNVLKRVKVWDYLEARKGLDTVISGSSSELSRGFRQRICMARAILADAPIYVFDSVTTDIDQESEKIILNEIRKLSDNKTVIIISHRLSSLIKADKIYALDKGEVIGEDGHIGLLKDCEGYRKLFQEQQKLENYVKTGGVRIKKYIKNDALNIQPSSSEEVYIGEEDAEDNVIFDKRPALVIVGRILGKVGSVLPVVMISALFGSMACILFSALIAAFGANLLGHYFTKSFYMILICGAAVIGILRYIENLCSSYIEIKSLTTLRLKLFEALRKLAPAWPDKSDGEVLISRLASDIERIKTFYSGIIPAIIKALTVSTIFVIFMFGKSKFAALVGLLGYYLVGVIVPFVIGKIGKRARSEVIEHSDRLNRFMTESIKGLDDIIGFNNGTVRSERIREESERLKICDRKLDSFEVNRKAVSNMLIGVTCIAVMVIAAWQAGYGAILGIDYILLITIIMSSFGAIIPLSEISNDMMATLESGERILRVFDEKPKVEEVIEPKEEGETDGEQRITNSELAFDNVSFSYGNRFVLKDVSFKFPENKTIAISGTTGSGKSTILKLLMRYRDPQFGNAELGGENLKSIRMKEIRSAESYVSQETRIMHDTIRNNIRLGRQDAADDEIEAVARKAELHDFIVSLENGYDTMIGDFEDSLSEGDKQRIGMARAILHNGPVILLDEPTENIDALSEGMMLKTIESIKDKTVVIASKKDQLINMADVIFEIQG